MEYERRHALCLLALVGGCNSSKEGGVDALTWDLELTTEDVTLQPDEQHTYCYYFHTPNNAPLPVDHWMSDLTPGVRSIVMYLGGAEHADGLDTSNGCAFGTSADNASKWAYTSEYMPVNDLQLPTDDGTGTPLAQVVDANTVAAIQMNILNTTSAPIAVHATVRAHALPAMTSFTRTEAYIAYNNSINIPPGATGVVASATCAVPTGKFWDLWAYERQQGVYADVKDGSATVYESTDWEHPLIKRWGTPFYTFNSGKLTWECMYNNTGLNASRTITNGPSAATDEACIGVGYYFPAPAPQFCTYDPQTPTPDHCTCI